MSHLDNVREMPVLASNAARKRPVAETGRLRVIRLTQLVIFSGLGALPRRGCGKYGRLAYRLWCGRFFRLMISVSAAETLIEPFRPAREASCTIPGVSTLVADVIIAETGADMNVFPTSAQLASWAGACPGSNESAGRIKSTKTMPGNKYLKGSLGIAAMSAFRGKNTYLSVKYKRIATRRGRLKAIVAIEHNILTATWHMLANGEIYQEPGADYYLKREPEQAKSRAIRQLKTLGYEVNLAPVVA